MTQSLPSWTDGDVFLDRESHAFKYILKSHSENQLKYNGNEEHWGFWWCHFKAFTFLLKLISKNVIEKLEYDTRDTSGQDFSIPTFDYSFK